MILQYENGKTSQGIALFQSEKTLRVALDGCEDIVELTRIHGHWVSEELEVVRLEPSWRVLRPVETLSEEDCVCSPELASRLIGSLLRGSQETKPAANLPGAACHDARSCRLM